ncbi:MAG: hypothetical protein KY469_10860 [Actinobacteria bacterium]|nr:hypothetical protein [Actinomycetota bacterium]
MNEDQWGRVLALLTARLNRDADAWVRLMPSDEQDWWDTAEAFARVALMFVDELAQERDVPMSELLEAVAMQSAVDDAWRGQGTDDDLS